MSWRRYSSFGQYRQPFSSWYGLLQIQFSSPAGSRIILVGLAISLTIFLLFIGLALYVNYVAQQKIKRNEIVGDDMRWRRLVPVLFLNMLVLLIRSCYRCAEYSYSNFHNPISVNEKLFYGCDIALMMLILIVWIPMFPDFHGIKASDIGGKKETELVAVQSPQMIEAQ